MIYKYLTLIGLQRILNSGRIRFTQASALNDPFECWPCFDRFKESLRQRSLKRLERERGRLTPSELIRGEAYIPYLVEDGSRKFIEVQRESHPMLCLTTESNNLLMWAHYSDSHGGCVIGFDDAHPFFNKEKPSPITKLMQVTYSETRPVLPSFEECMNNEDAHKMILLVKSLRWSYEKEWRMFAKPHVANFRGRDQKGLPLYLHDLPPDSVREIIFGHNVSREDRRGLTKLAHSKYPHLRFFEARLNPREFDLDIIPLQ